MAINFDGSYTQDFDSLLSAGSRNEWANNSTLSGWHLFSQPTSTPITTYTASSGGSNLGSFYSYGTTSSSDRALGGLGGGNSYFDNPEAGAIAGWIAFSAINATGTTLNNLEIRFDGEQWRNGSNATPQTMVLEYGFGDSFELVTDWIQPGGNFDWTSPLASLGSEATDGNAEGLVANRGGILSELNWAAGQQLWIRWVERNDEGNDHGLAIDNVSLTAVLPPPVVAIAPVTSASEGGPPGQFVINRTGATTSALVVSYLLSGSATPGADYTPLPTTITIPAGQASVTVSIEAIDDRLYEGNETIILSLIDGAQYDLATARSATLALQENDPEPTLSIADAVVDESEGLVFVTVRLSGASARPVAVNVGTSDGEAIAGLDYAAASTRLTFAPGETERQIAVSILDDEIDEADESFQIFLSNSNNAEITESAGVVTIHDDDEDLRPFIQVEDQDIQEGQQGSSIMEFDVFLSQSVEGVVSVQYRTVDDTAIANADYQAVQGTLEFQPGETQQSIRVTINGDLEFEENESFYLQFSDPVNAQIDNDRAQGTILNNDAQPRLRVGDRSVREGNSGTTNVSFALTLDQESGVPVVVSYRTQDGSATTRDRDYRSKSGRITFQPGQTRQVITVLANGDRRFEANETFSLRVTSATNARIADRTGVATLRNDDRDTAARRHNSPEATTAPIEGNSRDNTINGSAQSDVLLGFGGDDLLRGGRGDDRLDGGRGDDRLIGGADADRLIGGSGRDEFWLDAADAGSDRITDFDPRFDRLRIQVGETRILTFDHPLLRVRLVGSQDQPRTRLDVRTTEQEDFQTIATLDHIRPDQLTLANLL